MRISPPWEARATAPILYHRGWLWGPRGECRPEAQGPAAAHGQGWTPSVPSPPNGEQTEKEGRGGERWATGGRCPPRQASRPEAAPRGLLSEGETEGTGVLPWKRRRSLGRVGSRKQAGVFLLFSNLNFTCVFKSVMKVHRFDSGIVIQICHEEPAARHLSLSFPDRPFRLFLFCQI